MSRVAEPPRFLSEWLPDGTKCQQIQRVLMVRALANERRAWWTCEASKPVREGLIAISRQRPVDIVGATPFFWLNIHRIWDKLAHAKVPTRTDVAYLHVVAFDSFPKLVPDGLVRGGLWERTPISLPRCGVTLELVGSNVRLDRRVVDEAGPPELVKSRAGGQVFVCICRALFNDDARAQIDVQTEPEVFAERLRQAHALIQRVNPNLLRRLGDKIRWYVPLRVPSAHTHTPRSLTRPTQSGVMFLSATDDHVSLAETMVQELGHTELTETASGRPLLLEAHATAMSGAFYSPWHAEPRPLAALLTDLYVCCEVVSLHEGLQAARELGERCEWITRHRMLTLFRLALGLAQVPRVALTCFGHDLVDQIAGFVARREHEAHAAAPALQATILDHWTRWHRANPRLPIARPVAPQPARRRSA